MRCRRRDERHENRSETQTLVTFGLAWGVRVSKVSIVTEIAGVVLAKPRTIVTFGLVRCSRLKKVSIVTEIGGVRARESQNCRHFLDLPGGVSVSKSVNSDRDRGSWLRNPELSSLGLLASSRLKSVNRDPSTRLALRVSKVSRVIGIGGGSGSRKPRTVVICVSASQKCQQSQGSGGSWSGFWIRLGCSRLKSVNRDLGGRACETQNCRFLDSPGVFASQKCQ